ncbi:hypothetical protein ACIBSV_28555 [Embleya sp. NPDC050154]|uniref:hypothetical protein n=1 Tax=unclassified Embleya TaxID=2699296 RepID=UPI0037B00FE0
MRVLAWALRSSRPDPSGPHEVEVERTARPSGPRGPAARPGGWPDFVPPAPVDDPPVPAATKVVGSYPMSPEELAERRRTGVERARRQARFVATAHRGPG